MERRPRRGAPGGPGRKCRVPLPPHRDSSFPPSFTYGEVEARLKLVAQRVSALALSSGSHFLLVE